MFPRIIAGGDNFFFRTKRGRLEAIIRRKSSPTYSVSLNQKWSHQINWTWAFKCAKFSSLINFQCISSASELELSLISFAGSDCTSTWQRGDNRKRRWWEGEGAIIWERWLFQIFPSKGDDYWREVINRGTAIIRGNTVLYWKCFVLYLRRTLILSLRTLVLFVT